MKSFRAFYENIKLSSSNEDYMEIDDQFTARDYSKVDKKIIKCAEEAVKIFKAKINIPLWVDIKVVFIEDEEGGLGRFRGGTATNEYPIVMLSDENIKEAVDTFYDLDEIVRTTIWHELGHGIHFIDQFMGLKCIPVKTRKQEEDWAEAFVSVFEYDKPVPKEVTKLIQKLKIMQSSH
jgi:hypothetical protein